MALRSRGRGVVTVPASLDETSTEELELLGRTTLARLVAQRITNEVLSASEARRTSFNRALAQAQLDVISDRIQQQEQDAVEFEAAFDDDEDEDEKEAEVKLPESPEFFPDVQFDDRDDSSLVPEIPLAAILPPGRAAPASVVRRFSDRPSRRPDLSEWDGPDGGFFQRGRTRDNTQFNLIRSSRAFNRGDGVFRHRSVTYDYNGECFDAREGGAELTAGFIGALYQQWQDIRHREAADFQPGDRVQIIFETQAGIHSSFPRMDVAVLNSLESFTDRLSEGDIKLFDSDSEFCVTAVTFQYSRGPRRGGGKSPHVKGVGRGSIIKVYNHNESDFGCGPRALGLLLIRKMKDRSPALMKQWNRMRQARASNPKTAAAQTRIQVGDELSSAAGLTVDHLLSYSEIARMLPVLGEKMNCPVGLQIYDGAKNYKCVFEEMHYLPQETHGPTNFQIKNMEWFYLIHNGEHFDACVKMNRLLGNQAGYCPSCKKSFSGNHRCAVINPCNMCDHPDVNHFEQWKEVRGGKAEAGRAWVTCDSCNRNFFGQMCYERHLEKVNTFSRRGTASVEFSNCQAKWVCQHAACRDDKKRRGQGKSFLNPAYTSSSKALAPEDHVCFDNFWCNSCNVWVNDDAHKCYHKKQKVKKISEKYLFCDFECVQVERVQPDGERMLLHEVNLAVTYDFDGQCVGEHTCIEDWLTWVLGDEYKGYTVIFHNGKGYDFQFIIKAAAYWKGTSQIKVKVVMNGSKIMTASISKRRGGKRGSGGIRLVDSLNFLSMPLSAFPKTFGISMLKGYYPHMFNTWTNKHYRGSMPGIETFLPQKMSQKARSSFEKWYEKRSEEFPVEEAVMYGTWLGIKGYDVPDELPVWDNEYELGKYCHDDVKILRQGCLAFRQIILDATDGQHDPFSAATIAGSAMSVWRTLFQKDDTVASMKTHTMRRLRRGTSGGRTGACKIFYDTTVDETEEKIHYIDFTSLYPYINAHGMYPIGHPIEIFGKALKEHVGWSTDPTATLLQLHDMKQLAMITCDISCPKGLYHPLLHRFDNKTQRLMFDLCDKQDVTYTSLELVEAIKHGYCMSNVTYVAHWVNAEQGIFSEYVQAFLKLKQQANGWPMDDMSDEDKREYVDSYFKQTGIKLDIDMIEKNKGIYATSKIYLNSLWGKFSQRLNEDMTTSHILWDGDSKDLQTLNRLHENDEIANVLILTEDCIFVTATTPAERETEKRCPRRNYALGAFTTAQARLKLWRLLHSLGERVLYYDTDSVIWVSKDNDDPNALAPLGTQLGDLTNELGINKYEYGDEWITKFVTAGPKSYAYVTNQGHEVIKVKGFSTHKSGVAKHLNFDSMCNIIMGQTAEKLLIHDDQIARPTKFKVVTRQSQKTFQFRFTKRQILYDEAVFDATSGTYKAKYLDTAPWTDDTYHELIQITKDKSSCSNASAVMKRKSMMTDDSLGRDSKRYKVSGGMRAGFALLLTQHDGQLTLCGFEQKKTLMQYLQHDEMGVQTTLLLSVTGFQDKKSVDTYIQQYGTPDLTKWREGWPGLELEQYEMIALIFHLTQTIQTLQLTITISNELHPSILSKLHQTIAPYPFTLIRECTSSTILIPSQHE